MTLLTVNNAEYIAFLMWFLKYGRKHQLECTGLVLLLSLLELGTAPFNELNKATDFQAKLLTIYYHLLSNCMVKLFTVSNNGLLDRLLQISSQKFQLSHKPYSLLHRTDHIH